MKVVYLADGQACILKEQIGQKFIVHKILLSYDDVSGWTDVEDKNGIVVDRIFDKPPTEKIHAEIQELQTQKAQLRFDILELEEKKKSVQNEVSSLQKSLITEGSFIINRKEIFAANQIVLFPKDSPMPLIKEPSDFKFHGLELVLCVEMQTGKERAYAYKLIGGDKLGSIELCRKYGILIDPNPGQVDEIIRKRLAENKFSEYAMGKVPDQYLNDQQKEARRIKENAIKESNLVALQNKLMQAQKELSKFKSENPGYAD